MSTATKSRAGSLIELIAIVAVALGLALLIQAFVIKPYMIPSGSMEPTLKIGQRVLVDRIGMRFGGPSVGDIVVFHPPQGAGQQVCGSVAQAPHMVSYGGAPCSRPVSQEASVNFIKRVVAGPGEWIYVKEGHAYTAKRRQGPSSASTTPTSRPVEPAPSATSEPRSRFQPNTGS